MTPEFEAAFVASARQAMREFHQAVAAGARRMRGDDTDFGKRGTPSPTQETGR